MQDAWMQINHFFFYDTQSLSRRLYLYHCIDCVSLFTVSVVHIIIDRRYFFCAGTTDKENNATPPVLTGMICR